MSEPANAQPLGALGSLRWMDGMDIWIADAAIADADAAAASAGRSGFTLDLDQANHLLDETIRIRTELVHLQRKADELESLTPPAHDPASADYHGSLTRQGQQPGAFAYGAGHLHVEVDYLAELIRRLRQAVGRTEETDEDGARHLRKTPEGEGYAG
ncbi:hypothetical protein [Amycolatopsis sp. CA-230715]|uniref:hypothetical protein n=1 Tax=Amycolatopsis sp. CA-230715 TaxID=2745196 RepID=UPI001C01AD7A|nr:hypothetical protein [Amycolatopsis sp. CA-230715]QWF83726.1 hypothetical protein HUW46_07169 [Amycolatopsis sp. CA-230715]